MNFRALAVCLTLGVSVLPGCLPKKALDWSRDGQRIAVIVKAGVLVADADGRVCGEPFAPGAQQAVWFPEGRNLLVMRQADVTRWSDVAAILPEETRNQYVVLAARIFDEIKANQGKWPELKSEAEKSKDIVGTLERHNMPASADFARAHSANRAAAVGLRIADDHRDALKEFLGDDAKNLDALKATIWTLEVFDLSGDKPTPVRALVQTLDTIHEMRVAPKGQAVAFTVSPDSGLAAPDPDAVLYVASADGSAPPRQVAERVSRYPDWTEDGERLAFVRTNSTAPRHEDELRLGSVSRRRVCGPQGTVLPDADKQPIEDLVGTLFLPMTRVRCLPDTRILFVAAEAHLPTTAKDLRGQPALFAVSTAGQVKVERLIPKTPGAPAEQGIEFFEPSPNGARIAFATGDSAVKVVNILTGETWSLPGPFPSSSDQGLLRVIPAWRNDDEVSCIASERSPDGTPTRPEIVLVSSGAITRVVSQPWADRSVQGLLVPVPKPPAPGGSAPASGAAPPPAPAAKPGG
jgi:hypothetical protein